MKTAILAAATLLLFSSFTQQSDTDTTALQVRKIEHKAAMIKAQPQRHSIDDVYVLLIKSTNLTREVMRKGDSINTALVDAKNDLRSAKIDLHIVKEQTVILRGAAADNLEHDQQLYIVKRFIDTVPILFLCFVVLWIFIILYKRKHPSLSYH